MKKLLFISLVVFFSGCKSQPGISNLETKSIALDSGPCRGRCINQKLFISKDRSMEYEGIRSVKNIGKYTSEISKADYKNLLKLFEAADFMQMKESYENGISDIQKHTIDLGDKRVSFQLPEASEELKGLFDELNRIIFTYEWVEQQ